MEKLRIVVQVPASTANLGPGFDTLGMALPLYTWVEMTPAEQFEIVLYGDEIKHVAKSKKNLVYQAALKVFARAGVQEPTIKLSIYSDIPLSRGLGSSAAAIIGGMVAANAFIGEPFSKQEILNLATELEGHPDNVGAALYGGIIVAISEGAHVHHIPITPPEGLDVVLAIPNYRLSTAEARSVLPQSVALQDAVFNVSHASLLVATLASGKIDMIAAAMHDRLHQPYRAGLIAGLHHILREAQQHGALGVALSGAGPTILAFSDRRAEHKQELIAFLQATLHDEGVEARILDLQPTRTGAIVYRNDAIPFLERISM